MLLSRLSFLYFVCLQPNVFQIWFQSWDEKIESLIDFAVLRVLELSKQWKETSFVQDMYVIILSLFFVYLVIIMSVHSYDDYKLYEAVRKVFDETGRKKFFEQFVKLRDYVDYVISYYCCVLWMFSPSDSYRDYTCFFHRKQRTLSTGN